MSRRMRRFKQLLQMDDAVAILNAGTNGVLSLVDAEGEPYGVPLSYVYDGEGHIYFHSAVSGHKMECIEAESRCSFCVVAQDDIVPEEFTTYFRSVIAKGRVRIITDRDEMMRGLMLLCGKYSVGVDPAEEIARCINHVRVLRLDIESLTGKEAIELVRARGNQGAI